MAKKETPWKLENRPYDPDKRAKALRDRFARYRARNGASGGGRLLGGGGAGKSPKGNAAGSTKFVWLAVACAAVALVILSL